MSVRKPPEDGRGAGDSSPPPKAEPPRKPGQLTYEQLVTLSGPQPLWTVQRLATALGVSDDYVYGLANRGEIPCVRMGTNIRFHYKDVLVWFNQLRQPLPPSS